MNILTASIHQGSPFAIHNITKGISLDNSLEELNNYLKKKKERYRKVPNRLSLRMVIKYELKIIKVKRLIGKHMLGNIVL